MNALQDEGSFWQRMQQGQLVARAVDWGERLSHLQTVCSWPLELRNPVIVAYLAVPGQWNTPIRPEHEQILRGLLGENDRRLRLLAVQALSGGPLSASEQLLQTAAADEAYEVSSLAWSHLSNATNVAREVWRNYSAYCSEQRPELAGLLARQLPALWDLKPLGFRIGARGYEVDLSHGWQLHSLQSLTLRVKQSVTIQWALRNGCSGELELHKGDIWKAAVSPGFANLRDKLVTAIDLTWLSPYHFHGANVETFYGREHEINCLLRPGTHWAVTGGRRIGKTSLLLKTAERLRQHSLTVLYLDCGAYRRSQDFLLALAVELNLLPDADLSPAVFLATYRQSLPTGLHLFLDEVDVLFSSEPEIHSLLALLRTLAQQLNWQVIAAGYLVLHTEMSRPNSPLANFFAPLQLKPLCQQGAFQLLTWPLAELGMSVQGVDAMARQIYRDTGGHPALLQFIGHELVADANPRGSLEIKRPQWRRVIASQPIRSFCQHICLDHLSSAELAILLATADSERWSGAELAERFPQATNLISIIDHLVLQNLWKAVDSGWELAVPMLRQTMHVIKPRLQMKAAQWEGYHV